MYLTIDIFEAAMCVYSFQNLSYLLLRMIYIVFKKDGAEFLQLHHC